MILITGHKGFIGKNLVKRFIDSKMCLSDKDTCFEDFDELPWTQIDEIWHMGAISDTTETDIDKIYHYNIEYSIKLFEYAIHFQIPIKYASSASVYGNTKGDINPLNYYSLSKATVDLWVSDNLHKFVKIQGYRFFNVYGNGEEHKGNQSSPIHTFTNQAKETGVIKLFENSYHYVRDFVWVEDVIDCMMYNTTSGIYDVGTSWSRSFEDIGTLIAKKYNARIEYIPFPKHLKGKYQEYTGAKRCFNHDFISVEEYLERQS